MARRALTNGRNTLYTALFLIMLSLNSLGLAQTLDANSANVTLTSPPTESYHSASGDQGGG